MVSSSSPELTLSSSVDGLPAALSSSSRVPSRSSSSAGTPRKNRVRKSSQLPSQEGSPALLAGVPRGKKGGQGIRTSWKEMMQQKKALGDGVRDPGLEMDVSEPLSGLEPSTTIPGSGLSGATSSGAQDHRQIHHHQTFHQETPHLEYENQVQYNQTVQNFHDDRQTHHHQTVQQSVAAPSLDPLIMANAAEAVTGARTEAAQVVLDARTQVFEANAQFNAQLAQLKTELNARDAALALAGEREKMLNARLEECMRGIRSIAGKPFESGSKPK